MPINYLLYKQKSMNFDGDRLSNLSDDLIHKIFSSISSKLIVQTSILSSRWRFIWTSVPYLNLSSQDFKSLPNFSKFVKHVLSGRNRETEASSVELSFRGKVSQGFVKKIMNYAFSHNIQQLNLSYLTSDKSSEFPLSLLSFPSLRYLSLSNGMDYRSYRLKTTSSFELPALTTLYLYRVDLCNDGLFSKCANLKNLALKNCGIVDSENFSISHPRLSNLTLDSFRLNFVNVVAPKLENLTIRNCGIKISAPDLISLVYKGNYGAFPFSTDGFNSLKEADIYVSSPKYEHSRHIVRLLQHLHNVKFLVLSLGIVEILSLHEELIVHQPFLFTNLKRLKICPESAPNQSYFLDSSPGIILQEIVAQNLMVQLRVFLEQEKTKTKTDRTHMDRGEGPIESQNSKMLEQGKQKPEMKLQVGESIIAKIQSCWENLRLQIEQRESKDALIISKLQRIEGILAKLPSSKRDMIQPCFAGLCAEAVTVMGGITDWMKIQCEENQSRISVSVQQLATSLKSSS